MAQEQVEYHRLHVLVVEDEVHTRTIIKALLRQLGVRKISEAVNGLDGLVKLTDVKPHLVLCDVHMKPIDGREFLQKTREMEPPLRDTPVIFLTADAQRDTVVFAKEHAVSGYIVKPPSLAAIKTRIEALAELLKF